MPNILVASSDDLFLAVLRRKPNRQGSKNGVPWAPQGRAPTGSAARAVLCACSPVAPCPITPPPRPQVFFETVGAEATGSSQLAATDYVTEPMEPKLKEETILLPLNSPNPCLCPGPPARLQRS